jgi:hypothetical protein
MRGISANENIKPLVYHNWRYRRLGEDISKPSADVLATIEKLAEKYNRIKCPLGLPIDIIRCYIYIDRLHF